MPKNLSFSVDANFGIIRQTALHVFTYESGMLTAGRCHKAIYLSFLYPAVAFSDAFDFVDGRNVGDMLHDHL